MQSISILNPANSNTFFSQGNNHSFVVRAISTNSHVTKTSTNSQTDSQRKQTTSSSDLNMIPEKPTIFSLPVKSTNKKSRIHRNILFTFLLKASIVPLAHAFHLCSPSLKTRAEHPTLFTILSVIHPNR